MRGFEVFGIGAGLCWAAGIVLVACMRKDRGPGPGRELTAVLDDDGDSEIRGTRQEAGIWIRESLHEWTNDVCISMLVDWQQGATFARSIGHGMGFLSNKRKILR